MGQTLTNGIYLPDEGERNSYSGLEANWRTLDALILTVNGKAAPNIANTWTAAQTFTAGITGDLTGNVTGNLTGTASKAIADEDGTSIKTGYVNVAGNQTVTGQKTWSGVNYFNNENLYQIATNPRYAFKSSILEIGVQPSGHCTATVDWLDSNDAKLGYSRFVEYNNSVQTYEVLLKNKAENGSLSPAGNDISASLQLALFKTGSSQLNLGVDIIAPPSNNRASLGSSSYQWSSVYAQTYYYNGTAWGLDKANVWSNEQTILQSTSAQLKLKNSNIAVGDEVPSSQKTLGSLTFTGSNGLNMGFMDCRDSAQGNTFVRILARQKYDNNGNRSASGTTYESGMDIGVLNDTTPYVAPTSNAMAHLGTSKNKWKTLNGINPGALGIPDKGNMVNIASEFTDLTGGFNYYIPPADGFVSINADTDVYCAVVSSTHNTAFWRQSAVATSTGYASVTIPVRAGLHLQAKINSTVAIYAAFYPCLGNV